MSEINRRRLLGAAGLGLAALPLSAAAARAAGDTHGDPRSDERGDHGRTGLGPGTVTTGAERQARDGWSELRGQRVGIITNPTGILRDRRSIVDEMVGSGAVNVVAVFGPEHGFRGTAQAGSSEGTSTDPRTGVTVYDAYGASAEKLAGMFRTARVETVVFDIQDVGARFYTYIWTMYTAMRAAVATGARFVVLDRPNPVGGTARGPMMTKPWESGVGLKEIVQAHGMTVGELARFFGGEFLEADAGGRLAELTVVAVRGWRRDVPYAGTGLPWVMPSPNMPTPDTALVYPGMGMFEGTLLSEGRGTTRPFELIGAPWVDYRWAERLSAMDLPGTAFREAYFTPTFNKFVNTVCGGVQVEVTDPRRFDPLRVGVEMLVAARALYPQFGWRYDSYDPARPYWIDKVTGSTRLRDMVSAGATADDVTGAWAQELSAFERARRPYLLYPGA
ncbi:exo-beta-N-acetylmuramidase NamZ family protein [Oryzihumus leptocrescens]|uniref:Uncharacterized protein YbbC (DUF1343 family) n=1 Tax=Oryzihumus leptocrescens TaxID=297536 RepID=A0A542Z9M6_9MICO|nr:DUF1343 domain-containing protein [Oryzihumus leptocrescens]TQL57025.1 uncharacterized protein YbbC (DUF1343 family) [Oryzihumus leptocrescens]